MITLTHTKKTITYTEKYLPHILFSHLLPSLSVGEYKTGQTEMSQIIDLFFNTLCLQTFTTGCNSLQDKCRNLAQIKLGQK